MIENDEATPAPTQRKVFQPTNGGPRTYLRLLPGAPQFQEYVDKVDAHCAAEGKKPFPIEYLRDEYISTWGTN